MMSRLQGLILSASSCCARGLVLKYTLQQQGRCMWLQWHASAYMHATDIHVEMLCGQQTGPGPPNMMSKNYDPHNKDTSL
jgi:hypothetical protein